MKKTREFQTQLLHYFSKSDNKSNHHHVVHTTHSLSAVVIALKEHANVDNYISFDFQKRYMSFKKNYMSYKLFQ